MKLSVDLTKEKGFRIKLGHNVFLCERAAERSDDPPSLAPMEMFMASLGASFSAAAVEFCEEHALSSEGLQVTLDWDYAPEENRLSRINVSVHMPNSIGAESEDDFMTAIHTCDVYRTLMMKPEIHCHVTSDLERPEGEALVHFVGAE